MKSQELKAMNASITHQHGKELLKFRELLARISQEAKDLPEKTKKQGVLVGILH